jgi:hypothetical protein
MANSDADQPPNHDQAADARTWVSDGWTARVHKNEDDEGWAVSMTRDGDSEPVLVSPWTMGRDKKNPKPLGISDFKTLLKGANDVLTRHEAHARALRHKSVTVYDDSGAAVRVDLDIAADEDDPHAVLSAWDDSGEQLAAQRVAPNFAFSSAKASRWVEGGFRDV